MKEENNNSAGVWVTMAFGALLLYMLSVGPVELLFVKTRGLYNLPGWFTTIYKPIFVLCQHGSIAAQFYNYYYQIIGLG